MYNFVVRDVIVCFVVDRVNWLIVLHRRTMFTIFGRYLIRVHRRKSVDIRRFLSRFPLFHILSSLMNLGRLIPGCWRRRRRRRFIFFADQTDNLLNCDVHHCNIICLRTPCIMMQNVAVNVASRRCTFYDGVSVSVSAQMPGCLEVYGWGLLYCARQTTNISMHRTYIYEVWNRHCVVPYFHFFSGHHKCIFTQQLVILR